MKTKILWIATAILLFNCLQMQAQSSKNDKKILITYFTVPETDGVDASSGASRIIADGKLQGNTEYVATIIQKETKGELFAIRTIQQYPGTHKELIDYAKTENDSKARPKLISKIDNLDKYDVIFVGFPNWWYDMPMPLYTFFEEHDFSGKTIVPFCTHGGSRFSQAIKTITELEKNTKILDGYSVSRDNLTAAKEEVAIWLQKIGIKESN
jgi:flavodoxin